MRGICPEAPIRREQRSVEDPLPRPSAPDEPLAAQVAPPGSNLYYSLLFAAPGEHRSLCAVAAWQQEARSLAFAPRDRGVALARIEWWREESQRLRSGAPRHPIARALLETEHACPASMGEGMHRMLERVRRLVAQDRVMEEEELWQHCDALGSQGETMIATALAAGSRTPPGTLDALGRGLEMLELVRPPPGYRHLTPRMVPRARDEALAGESGGGAPEPGNPAMRSLLRERGARGQRLLRDALERLVRSPSPSARSRAVLARLALSQLEVLDRDGYRRWEVGLSPLRKLWTAWRAARRHA